MPKSAITNANTREASRRKADEIEFDTSINHSDGSIAYLAISQNVVSGRRMRVVLNREELTRLIARINGSLIYINGEFKLTERPEKPT